MLLFGFIILGVHITLSSARQANCDERGPICGNDGKTYRTMCQLILAKLEDTDLAVLHEGNCNGKYLSSMLQPTEVNTGSGKVVLNTKGRKIDYEKIRVLMPVGWPPLGPISVTNKPPLNRRSRKRNETSKTRKRKNMSF